MSGRRSANKQGTTNGVRYAKGDPNGLSSSSSYETAESEAADDVDSDTDSPAPNQTGSGLVNAQHSPDEYRAGSIMHISLRNFVTYDRIEVSPGPNLNMIIGPNGTGKSTIVCAIALGLGEKPSVLGRAKDISEYVKHGHESGSIEITLAGKDGSGPVRIRRDINHQNNTSSWKLNGRAATFSEVSSMTKSMHIQVNNLCQFLPQDRVVEFSKMSPQELLKETQKALGRDDLWDLQKRIVEKRAQERQKLTEIQRLRHDTETLHKQNDVLERDVQRWQERQAAESQMRVLTALIPVVKYTEAKAGHDRRKEERRRAHTNYMEVRNQPGPAEDEIKTLDGKIARNENTRRRRQEERNEFEKEARHQLNQLERLDKTQTDLQNEFEELKKRAHRRREEI
ncbi:Structural maintenance of chromosomes protein 5, partial [Linderina pennispora]